MKEQSRAQILHNLLFPLVRCSPKALSKLEMFGNQTRSNFVTKQSLICQTFPIWTGLNKNKDNPVNKQVLHFCDFFLRSVQKSKCLTIKHAGIRPIQAAKRLFCYLFIILLQYRSEISGLRTHKTHATIFAQTRVKKRVRQCTFSCICTHLMRVFPFVIHSHNCALCGILLYYRKQNKRHKRHNCR